MTVALVSDAHMRTLNRQFRGKDYPTDVLSFPAAADSREKSSPQVPASPPALSGISSELRRGRPHLGDIAIATGIARRQARAAGHRPTEELRILALHGLLHLLGYDHERDNGQMARVERRLRQKGGLREALTERR